MKLDVFCEVDKVVRIFAGEGRVFEKRTDDRDKEAGEPFLGAAAVRDDVPGGVLFIGFVCFNKGVQ